MMGGARTSEMLVNFYQTTHYMALQSGRQPSSYSQLWEPQILFKKSINFNIGYDNKSTEEVLTSKFLGLQINSNLIWLKHTEYIIHKLSSACFATRAVTPLLKVDTS
jgi:hypothetical protein